jgi:hypothetical protein
MFWYKYYPGLNPPEEIPEEDYSYPFLKRSVQQFSPSDNISQGQWLFIDVSLLDIDNYYDQSLQLTTDPGSYIMVHERSIDGGEFTVVESVINEGFLYFKAAQDHQKNQPVLGTYCLYYKTPNLKEFSGDEEIEFEEIEVLDYEVLPSDTKTYSFSFVNAASDWDDGLTQFSGSKVYGTFSGPSFILKGNRGPDRGIFTIKVTGLPNEDFIVTEVIVNSVQVDTYSSTVQEDVIIYSLENLNLRDYTFEITNSYSKNILSTGNTIDFNSYSFTYNPYIKFGPEMINREAHVYSQINGVR